MKEGGLEQGGMWALGVGTQAPWQFRAGTPRLPPQDWWTRQWWRGNPAIPGNLWAGLGDVTWPSAPPRPRPARTRAAPGAEIQIWTAAEDRVWHWRLREEESWLWEKSPARTPGATLSPDSLLFFSWVWTTVSIVSLCTHDAWGDGPVYRGEKICGRSPPWPLSAPTPAFPPSLRHPLSPPAGSARAPAQCVRSCARGPRGPRGTLQGLVGEGEGGERRPCPLRLGLFCDLAVVSLLQTQVWEESCESLKKR
jgi:hypothetical protein